MASIQFDGTEILTSAYIPQFVKHETAPDRMIMSIPLAREDGEAYISERYGKKVITLRGTLKAASQDALDGAIDSFKELFSRPEKNLDISWNSGTRRYVATCARHEFDRDHYHTNAVPWSADFVVSSGVGKDTSDTTALNENALTTDDTDEAGDFIAEDSFTLAGSAAPKPVITLEVVSADADMKGIEYENQDTGERIIITRDVDWSAAVGKQIVIDFANKKVTDNLATSGQVEGSFSGLFPSSKIGTNNVRIRSGGIVNQRSSEDSLDTNIVAFTSSDIIYAVSFQVPYADDTFGPIILGLCKSGTPAGDLQIAIREDSGGEPDLGSSLAASTVDELDVPTTPTREYVRATLTGGITASLQANTTYWLTVTDPNGTGTDCFRWAGETGATYPRGGPLLSSNGGSSWVVGGAVPAFRILMGGVSAATQLKHSVVYRKTYL